MSAKGGITEGKSHKEGGIPMVVKSTGQHVELEGGEGVINKRNMASEKTFEFEGKEKTICEIASEINSADGNGVQIDCDNVTGKKYEYAKGGKILDEEQESSFKEWMDDGNVVEFEKGVYSTQDAQYSNRLKGMDELRRYFRKEFLSDSYGNGGGVDEYINIDRMNPTQYELVTNFNTLKSLAKNGFIELHEKTGLRYKNYESKDRYRENRVTNVRHDYIESAKSAKFEFKNRKYAIGYVKGLNFLKLYVLEDISDYARTRKFAGGGGVDDYQIYVYSDEESPTGKIYEIEDLRFPTLDGAKKYAKSKGYPINIVEMYYGSDFNKGGSVEDYKSLIGKYVNIYSMGVSLPTQNKIQDVMVSDERFRYRDITLKFDIGNAIIPLNKADLFMNNKIIIVKDSKEEYGIQLIPNQFAKGGRMSSALKLSDYETAQMSAGGYEEQMIVPQSTTGMYKEGGKVEYVDINGRNTYYFLRFPEAIGSFAWMYNDKYNEGILYNLDEFDKDYYSHLSLKSGEKLFRYSTDRMIDGSKRLIKINLERGLIYFMSENNDENDDKNVKFEKRGIKSQYIVLNKDMFGEGGKIVVYAENEKGYYRKISEHDTMRGAKTKMNNILDSEEYYGVGAVPIDVWEKNYAPYQFKEGGDVPKASKMFHLPLELAVYVPSTQDVDEVISEDELNARVNEVSKYLASTFGGFTKSERVGGFMTSKSELVTEDVVPVVSFATKEDYQANKNKLVEKLSEWARKWGQEAIGFEFEGDLYYVPQKFAKGGGVDNVIKKKVKSYEELQNHPLVDIIEREYNAGAFDGTDYSYWLYLKDGYMFESLGTTHLHEGFKKDLIRAFNEENIIEKPNEFKEGGDVRDFDWYQGFKKQQLKKGTEHEMEHIDTIREFKKEGVSDQEVAEAIAKDHLEEDENYYIELEKMESSRKVSEALGEFKKNKNRNKNTRKFNLGGFMEGNEGAMIYIKMKEDLTTDLFTLSGDYFSDSTFKKDSVNLMNFISNNGYSSKLELYKSGVYADFPNKSFEVVGYDSNKYGKGGNVKPQFDSLLLSANDKKIMEVLRTLNEENATHQQREMISKFRGTNVVNELTNQVISKIYGLLFQWHNLENPIHNIVIQNAGAGNIVSLVPANLMQNVYISFDENNLFYSVESKICGIVNTTIKFSELNDYAMKSVDAIVKVYGEGNPKYDTLVGDLYKSDKRAIILGVAEFSTLKHLEEFKVTIAKNLGGLAENQMLIPKSTYYVVINDGITDEANYTLIYGVTKI
jgi:hypothetical protein